MNFRIGLLNYPAKVIGPHVVFLEATYPLRIMRHLAKDLLARNEVTNLSTAYICPVSPNIMNCRLRYTLLGVPALFFGGNNLTDTCG